MKPKIELTEQMNFAGWESGYYNPKYNVGNAVLIAGPEGEKLKVIFDRPASRLVYEKHHFLFIMGVGNLIAQAVVNKVHRHGGKPKYRVRLALNRVSALTTETVQDQQLPTADTTLLWAYQGEHESHQDVMRLDYYSKVVGFSEAHKALLQAALEKAFTPRDQQRLFWGEPRVKAPEYA